MFRNSSSSHLCSLPDPVSPSVPPVSLPGTIRPPRTGPDLQEQGPTNVESA